MRRYSTAETKNSDPIPVLEYDFRLGQHAKVSKSAPSEFAALDERAVYLITASAPVFLTVDRAPGATAGSIYVAAGLPLHLVIDAGAVIRVIAVDGDADVFVVPAE